MFLVTKFSTAPAYCLNLPILPHRKKKRANKLTDSTLKAKRQERDRLRKQNKSEELIRVATSVAFYDFGPTIPVLRELGECKTRCAAMHKPGVRRVGERAFWTDLHGRVRHRTHGTGRSGTALLTLRILYYL